MQLDKRTGILSLISRAPPKVLRRCGCCPKCGAPAVLAALAGLDRGPEWELLLDPTAPHAVVQEGHTCASSIVGPLLGE